MQNEVNTQIVVSVLCIAYNHEKYIRKALDSVVEQKTNFKYEIIVHDDKSTDHTAEIIREYASKYPDSIIPIFEEENQYSQVGWNGVVEIMLQHCSGKYIAFLECDDYWCDENKLQKQAEFLEEHLDYSACSASCLVYDELINEKYEYFHVDEDIDLSIGDVVEWDKHHYQTSSLMIRKKYLIVPKEYYIKEFGDYPLAIYLRINGKIRYFSKNMSVYRFLAVGSWSIQTRKDVSMWGKCLLDVLNMLNNVQPILPAEFKEPVEKKIRLLEYQYNLHINNYSVLKSEYSDYFNKLSLINRFKVKVKYYCPIFGRTWRKIKSLIYSM